MVQTFHLKVEGSEGKSDIEDRKANCNWSPKGVFTIVTSMQHCLEFSIKAI